MNVLLQNLKQVFTKPLYIGIAILAGLLFYMFNVFIVNTRTFFHAFQYGFFDGIRFIFNLHFGLHEIIEFHSFITIIILSVLFGILVSLIVFKIRFAKKINTKHEGKLATSGIFLGLIAPGCSVCGVGLASFLGLSSVFITFFPFHGLELSILAIIILMITIMHLLNNLTTCKLKH